MRRYPIVLSTLVLVLLGVTVAASGGPSTAQEAADGPDLVGSWRVVISTADGRSFTTLSTYSADGTVVSSGSPVQPPPPGTPPGLVFLSAAHGAWSATGPDTANVTFVHLRAGAEGQPLGTLTIRTAVTVGADGQTVSGEFVTTLADPAGTTRATFAGTVHGTRIVAEAPGMPAASTPTG